MILPYATGELEGTGGRLRARDGHFVVEEIPLYDASGTGSHLYLNFTKERLTTKEACGIISGASGVNEKEIGFAGMKDKHAVTTQTFSIPVPNMNSGDVDLLIARMESLPMKLNWAKLHGNKLRTGHLLGNRFTILISGIDGSIDSALEKAEAVGRMIKERGIPNYFGEQRFGAEGDNHEKGMKIINGTMRVGNRWLRRFLVSSFQSHMCNIYLSERFNRGLFWRILEGDIAKKHDTGGLFEVSDEKECQKRFDSHEISFTAPIYGSKMWSASGEPGRLEQEIFSSCGVSAEQLASAGVEGTRRLGRLLVPDLVARKSAEGLTVSFSLPKGAFATTVMREIMKKDMDSSDSV